MSGQVYYNDNNPFCCEVLQKNIERGNLPKGTVDGRSITDVTASDLVGYQHIHLFAGIGGFPYGFSLSGVPLSKRMLTGGFPCQDISSAGTKTGIDGTRSGLWREMHRLVCEIQPSLVIVENSSDILLPGRGFTRVLGDLARGGYDAEWRVYRASDFGAPHGRPRLFLIAYPTSLGQPKPRYFRKDPYTDQALRKREWKTTRAIDALRRGTLPTLCRESHGLPRRMDRLTALGNAIVVQAAQEIGRCIVESEVVA